MEKLNALKKFDAFSLKTMAVLSMLIDHTGVSLFPKLIILRYIGRMAFPIYCMLLVEGYYHTKDIRKYLGRLLIFAFVSEIPFDMALFHSYFHLDNQNIFFTLFLGLMTIYFMEHMMVDMDIPEDVYKLLVIAMGCVLAELLKTDYGMSGIFVILIFYFGGDKSVWLRNICAEIMFFSMNTIEAFAGIALIPITLYNGERGKDSKLIQYAFYAVYPVHLLLLGLIRMNFR